MRFSWSQEPIKAIAYLRKKRSELHFDYDEIIHEAHHKAFTVAKITQLDLLSDIQDSLISARQEGLPFDAWQKTLTPTLKQKGWYGKTEVTNPKTGEIKEIYVGSRRLRNIFYTNTRVAYNVGRAQAQYQLPHSVYLRYVAILDSRVRPKHAANHGIIRHRDDPFWATHYPPNGWNCRCRVQAYSKTEIERRGWEDKLTAPLHDIAHPDWRHDIRNESRKALEAYAQKHIKQKGGDIAAMIVSEYAHKERTIRQRALDEMIDEVIVNGNQKYPVNIIPIGALSDALVEAVEKQTGNKLESRGVVLEKNRLMHAAPKRKEAYGQALRVEEMHQIVEVIEEEERVYFDADPKHGNIVYLFADAQDEEMSNLVIVHMDRVVKKFEKSNSIVTLAKVNRKEVKKRVKSKIYQPLK